ncbi:MAG: very short patch repair endonuclease [Candidatus Margulisiibacteriota bacterium]
MVDVFSRPERSRIMSLIRSKNTKLEQHFLQLLSSVIYPQGLRYRKHYAGLPGKPDIVFVSKKIAVFIDGDFWHGYKFRVQKQRLPRRYWLNKIESNISRDRKINRTLQKMGWRVIRIWEHQIKKAPLREVASIVKIIRSSK